MAERQAQAAEAARIQSLKEGYLDKIERTYLKYRRDAHSMRGTDLEAFPKLKLPRPPEEVANDPEVRPHHPRLLAGADELRVEMASNVPYVHGSKPTAAKSTGDVARPEERSDGGRDVRGHNR